MVYSPRGSDPVFKKRKLNRQEKNDETKRRLFAAATKIVGELGYAEASISRITAEAKVAEGTFYNHFESRQALLDQLLPALGKDMLEFIRNAVDPTASEIDKELNRFRAFYQFLEKTPEFLRILHEAEFFAPKGYRAHIENIASKYVSTLRKGAAKSGSSLYSPHELEVVVHLLMGARSYIGQRYAYRNGKVCRIPAHVLTAYAKLLEHGLCFPKGAETLAPKKRALDGRTRRVSVRAKSKGRVCSAKLLTS